MSGHLAAVIAIVAGTALAMEAVAALVHRYWMHGPGWGWHRSHHEPGGGRLERNDLYGVVGAAVAVAAMLAGQGERWPLYWVGVGMTLYGALYFAVHDGLVHRRWPFRFTPRSGYLRRLVQAHRLHHAVRGREGCVSFGFLYAPPAHRLAAGLRDRRRVARHTSDPAARAQGVRGVALAALIVAAWLALQAYALFVHDWTLAGALLAPLLVAVICWLNVGLFIVAHDAMHGSLAPSYRRLNRALGRLCLALYAGFSLDRVAPLHHLHHRHPGSDGDPDFHAEGAPGFWRWYGGFMQRYFGWREAAGVAAMFAVLAAFAPLANVIVFWALPAILSSVQLFVFGTWLPHRRGESAFDDRHRARSNDYGQLASLLSCFHFGYHHEHHLHPRVPWWRLPAVRRARAVKPASRDRDASTFRREAPAHRPAAPTPPCSPPP